MSFILDALRKSDAERQRGAAPGLADVRYATHRGRRNIWVPLLAVVLAANIGFMAWLWYDRSNGVCAGRHRRISPCRWPLPLCRQSHPFLRRQSVRWRGRRHRSSRLSHPKCKAICLQSRP